jgi:hypothetical protein
MSRPMTGSANVVTVIAPISVICTAPNSVNAPLAVERSRSIVLL